MRGIERGLATAVAGLAHASACSLFVDTSGLSGCKADAGDSGDAATTLDGARIADASEEDTATANAPMLVQERGTSGSTTDTLMVSLPSQATSGDTLLLVAVSNEGYPIAVS